MKGHAPRVIKTPGFNIRSKYDLRELRERRQQFKKTSVDFGLSLTAMIDMFSTLVIFLLLNFSATGEAYFVSKNVVIPKATNVRPLETAPLISITKDSLIIDSTATSKTAILLASLHDNHALVRSALDKIKRQQDELIKFGLPQKKQINLQADEATSVGQIKQVMNLLIKEGFSGINFAVHEVNERDL